jgi:hypothetical protein
MKWLRCYLDAKEPTLKEFAEVVAELTERNDAIWERCPVSSLAGSVGGETVSQLAICLVPLLVEPHPDGPSRNAARRSRRP